MDMNAVFAQFPRLESDRLLLERIDERHLDDLYDIYSNDKVFAYCGIIPKHNKQTVKKMIGHFDRDYRKQSRIKWGILLKQEREKLVGIMEAFDFQPKVEMVTIGYFLAEAYWGRGIAREAVQVAVDFLMKEAQANRIQAEVMPANEASRKVLLANGFRHEGTLRQATFWTGQGIVDLQIYGLLKDDEAVASKENSLTGK
ncbi:GNAT family N-acetyltransferase [Brevibacillus fulvus]|uniref:Ribosomal-protein-alanine N-acetyltransferase n=1 Tax=Brevibacillus fulvus TaxID=1125967 RepID=A0A939BUJ2_9BACL|nr:GNAT family protein [Brevibacillus fulvus]MBM7589621.1 ribosomal-protein-alanine N-acetyltransferase [Brevibacillus fulvus]